MSGNINFDGWINDDGSENYKCRAWVNFDGTGTVAIRASGNVSSITDNGTGDYTVNFTTAMPDANYVMSGSVDDTAFGSYVVVGNSNTARTTSAYRFRTWGGAAFDFTIVSVSFFR
jgi:hypothetical protein